MGPIDKVYRAFFMAYLKPAISLEEQIMRLKANGLQFNDEAKAKHHLRYIGYFRLRGYFSSIAIDPTDWKQGFRPDVGFEYLLDIYNVDRELRLLTAHMLERFEVAIRALLVEHFCGHLGPVW